MSKKRVAVAMSGGVDSSLVTARLQAQGYDVIGVTTLLFDTVENNKVVESATITDAKRVADQLAVPHYVLDLRQSFEEKIMQYFTQSYACGITPNPCVMCNDWIKFGSLYEFSRDLDADFLATGHYARVLYNQESNLYELRRGTDLKKDQSYVLYHLNQKMLPHIMFPLGEMHKEDTRALAKELNLPVYNKPESQDICFIPDNDHIRFLKERIPEQFVPGDIVDLEGSILGTHQGLPAYTIGQRKGLGVAAEHPLYVVAIDAKHNRVIVGPNASIFQREVWALDPSFTEWETCTEPFTAQAKIRYAAPAADCTVYPVKDGVHVVFKEPQRAVTPGQSIVFYDGDRVLGGAIIGPNHWQGENIRVH